MTTIYVTNNSDISLVDGWDGVKYTFKPGSTVEIPLSIAKHILVTEMNIKNRIWLAWVGLNLKMT